VIESQILSPRPRVQVHIDRGDTNETSDGGYTTSERWPIHTKAGVGRILLAIGRYRGPTEAFHAQWVAMMGKAGSTVTEVRDGETWSGNLPPRRG
jgi:hypothetical protein